MTDLFLGYPDEGIINWIKGNFDYSTIPLCFEALEDGHIYIQIKCNGNIMYDTDGNLVDDFFEQYVQYIPNISFLYSFDNITWNDWDYKKGIDIITGQMFYLKAKTENTKFDNDFTEEGIIKSIICYFSIPFKSNISGNIMSLLYNNFIDKKELKENMSCSGLFINSGLIDASNLILPATTLTKSCYSSLFSNCTSLIYAPKQLPATILTTSCYSYMFNMCTALANTPKLCATVLADNCYTSMFFNTAITNAPELPATILAEYCYGEMFCYCTNLISAPKLPATTLADSCYSYMFEDCSKITELHYPSSIENNSTFTSMDGSPQFGATNAIIYYDL